MRRWSTQSLRFDDRWQTARYESWIHVLLWSHIHIYVYIHRYIYFLFSHLKKKEILGDFCFEIVKYLEHSSSWYKSEFSKIKWRYIQLIYTFMNLHKMWLYAYGYLSLHICMLYALFKRFIWLRRLNIFKFVNCMMEI